MRGIVLREPGGPEVLQIAELPDPVAGKGELLVRVEAAAVNRYDLAVRAGNSPFSLPLIPGFDAAGVRLDSGERVQVTGGRGGCYAELVAAHESIVYTTPAQVTTEAAAALGTPFDTAWSALVQDGELEPGQTVLIQAGASSTGAACIQLARALDATVYATASAQKLERLAALGATALPYGDPQLAQLAAEIVYDPVGAATIADSLAALGKGGRLVVPGALGEPELQIDVRALVSKRARLIGTGATYGREKHERLLALAAAGRLTPVIDRVLPLDQAAQAHQLLEERATFGTLLLKP